MPETAHLPALASPRSTLSLKWEDITADQFKAAVDAYISLLYAVTRDVVGSPKGVTWTIKVRSGSALVDATPLTDASTARKLTTRVSSTWNTIAAGGKVIDVVPQDVIDPIEDLHELALSLSGENARIIAISTDASEEVFASQAGLQTLRTLAGESYSDYGSIEGRLHTISVLGTLKLKIKEVITNNNVACKIPERMRQESIDAFGQRVTATGLIGYKADGTPMKIAIDRPLFVFPEESQLPPVQQLIGLLRA